MIHGQMPGPVAIFRVSYCLKNPKYTIHSKTSILTTIGRMGKSFWGYGSMVGLRFANTKKKRIPVYPPMGHSVSQKTAPDIRIGLFLYGNNPNDERSGQEAVIHHCPVIPRGAPWLCWLGRAPAFYHHAFEKISIYLAAPTGQEAIPSSNRVDIPNRRKSFTAKNAGVITVFDNGNVLAIGTAAEFELWFKPIWMGDSHPT